jgi:hypothetical protein
MESFFEKYNLSHYQNINELSDEKAQLLISDMIAEISKLYESETITENKKKIIENLDIIGFDKIIELYKPFFKNIFIEDYLKFINRKKNYKGGNLSLDIFELSEIDALSREEIEKFEILCQTIISEDLAKDYLTMSYNDYTFETNTGSIKELHNPYFISKCNQTTQNIYNNILRYVSIFDEYGNVYCFYEFVMLKLFNFNIPKFNIEFEIAVKDKLISTYKYISELRKIGIIKKGPFFYDWEINDYYLPLMELELNHQNLESSNQIINEVFLFKFKECKESKKKLDDKKLIQYLHSVKSDTIINLNKIYIEYQDEKNFRNKDNYENLEKIIQKLLIYETLVFVSASAGLSYFFGASNPALATFLLGSSIVFIQYRNQEQYLELNETIKNLETQGSSADLVKKFYLGEIYLPKQGEIFTNMKVAYELLLDKYHVTETNFTHINDKYEEFISLGFNLYNDFNDFIRCIKNLKSQLLSIKFSKINETTQARILEKFADPRDRQMSFLALKYEVGLPQIKQAIENYNQNMSALTIFTQPSADKQLREIVIDNDTSSLRQRHRQIKNISDEDKSPISERKKHNGGIAKKKYSKKNKIIKLKNKSRNNKKIYTY